MEEEGEVREKKMRKKKRRMMMDGKWRKRDPWVVKLVVGWEGVKEEVGEVKRGDGGRGSGERD